MFDLVDTIVPYFAAGMVNNERCVWVAPEPLVAQHAELELRRLFPDLDDYFAERRIEFDSGRAWRDREGTTAASSIAADWLSREEEALRQGLSGLRIVGDVHRFDQRDLDSLSTCDAALDRTSKGRRIIALCSYSLHECTAAQIAAVMKTHGFALARRDGVWERLELPSLVIAAVERERTGPAAISDAAARYDEGRESGVTELRPTATALETEAELRRLLEGQRVVQTAQLEAVERLAQLQQVTSLLSEAASLADIADVVTGAMASLVHAHRASLAIPGENARLVLFTTPPHDGGDRRGRDLATDADLPIATAYREGAVWLEAMACVRLSVRERRLGALGFEFFSPRGFDAHDRALINDLARQTALALERSRLYETAQRAIAKRDEFLSLASHELKTPLTSLLLNVQSLLRLARAEGAVDQGAVVRRLEKVNLAVSRMTALIDDLLEVSQLTGGSLVIERHSFEIAALVKEVADRFEDEARRAGSELRLVIEDGAFGRWDRERIDRVITNLLSNALKYGEGRPIEIFVGRNQEKAIVSVKDEGIGVAPEDHDRIFERFERTSTALHQGGLGLGLWIAREIAKAHAGSLSVTSALGRGSVFSLELPIDSNTSF